MAAYKRKRCQEDGSEESARTTKRSRILGKNLYDYLSDELTLRILSFLSSSELVTVERVCKRFRRLGVDNGIWREKFYTQFVYPRMRRLPSLSGLHEKERDRAAFEHASRAIKRQEQFEKYREKTDWKHRFKVKLNWSKGRCVAHELQLDCPAQPRLLVRVCRGVTITASEQGLKAYCQTDSQGSSITHTWASSTSKPTSLAMCEQEDQKVITVGFNDGNVDIYHLNHEYEFLLQSQFDLGSGAAITDLALTWPYVLVLSQNTTIKLVQVKRTKSAESDSYAAVTLANLQSISAVSLTSLSIRQVSSTLIASIAYPFHRINAGYCLGIQEIRMNLLGEVTQSRLASTIDTPFHDFPLRKNSQLLSRAATTATFPLHPHLMHLPNSISHSGCYVLVGLPDNTLMVYTVSSTADSLQISGGRRLWGHTSSISGTQVSDRGKALSVSIKGDEIRVWELEDILSAHSLQRTSTVLRPQPVSSTLATALAKRGDGLGLAICEMNHELAWTRHWIGFDDEQVVVLGERNHRQVLSCFSFA